MKVQGYLAVPFQSLNAELSGKEGVKSSLVTGGLFIGDMVTKRNRPRNLIAGKKEKSRRGDDYE